MISKLPSVPGGGKSMNRLDKLNQAWLAWVVQSNDHHDVNNIIGPDILGNTDDKCQGLPGAFLRRLAWSGHNLEEADEWKSWGALGASNSLFGKPLSVFVVDDQLQQGWGRFVCRLFGNEKISNEKFETDKFVQLNSTQKIKIFGCLGSNPLITFLQNKAISDRRDFHVQISQEQNPSPELILLDLRLYAKITEAQQQAQLLLEIIEKQIKVCGNKLAWPEIAKEELEHIKSWCDGKASSAVETPDDALLLLPRLLALALPLTPIILFSSTNQSRIREKLKPYQNIFTGFEKPRVLSSPDSITASICALHDGLDKAVMMMRLRLQLAHAQKAACQASDLRENNLRTGSFLENQDIEIFADETRTLEEGIISGLAVCFYPRVQARENMQNILFKEFEKGNGKVWAKKEKLRKDETPLTPQLKKGEKIAHSSQGITCQVEKLLSLFNEVQLLEKERRLWSVVATKVEPITPQTQEVSLAFFPDGPLDDALRFNLEFILFVLIPFFTIESFQGHIYIYLPTRSAELSSNDKSKLNDYVAELSDAFDLGVPKVSTDISEPYVATVRTFNLGKLIDTRCRLGTGFPLIRGWIHAWRVGNELPSIAKKIRKIRMTVLGNNKTRIDSGEAKERALLHDIADWVCTASNSVVGEKLKSELKSKNIFPHWFISTDTGKIGSNKLYRQDTKDAMTLMQALFTEQTRVGQSGLATDVLRIVLRNSYIVGCDRRLIDNKYCCQQRLILWKLREQIRHASGRDLHALLADEVRENPVKKTGIPEAQVSAIMSNIIEPQVIETEENKNVAVFKAILAELVKEADSYEFSEEQINERVPNKQVFSTNDINWGSSAKAMFFSAADSGNSIYSVRDKEIITHLKQEAIWAEPLTVFGLQLGKVYKGTNRIHVFAAKLLNKKWQISPIEE
jgi:hypothetical protein